MTRMTRAESQARTRTQLLRTARELFLRDGYLATSLDKVADAAGFSKGAVYSNFRNKDELCLAVLDELRAERVAEITGLLSAPTTDERLRRFEAWAERVIGDPQWTTLEFEFAVQARRDPGLRQAMADRLTAVTQTVESALAGLTAGDAAEGNQGLDTGDAHDGSHAPGTPDTHDGRRTPGPGDDRRPGLEHAADDGGRGPGVGHAVGDGSHRPEPGDAVDNSRGPGEAIESRGPGEAIESRGLGDVIESRGRVASPMAGDQAAVALLCLGVGLGLFRSIDPAMPVGALVDTVRVLAGLPTAR